MAERPTGAVTFLFTDIEGSTQAWENDATGMAADLEVHDRILQEAIESNGGFVFATGGDSFSAAFSSPASALHAAAQAQRGLVDSGCGMKVRMGVHSGEAIERDGNYFGPPLNQTARLMSVGHGGQVLVSDITKGLVAAAGFEFLDLGEHRLADLSNPVQIAQLIAEGMDAEFPALRSVVTTDNLPRLAEVFGRESDIEQVAGLLSKHRLVTLTGAGGIGKTTLGASAATHMDDAFPDGRWLVDLTDLPRGSDRTAITGAVAGVHGRFSSIDALAPRRMLLVLDNCEHVLDGVRSYVDDLLDIAPDVTVLATSREPLRVRGERALPVAPLSVDEDSDHGSAIDLFVTRAIETGVTLDLNADRDTIAAICQAVGGLPLAIELAAARTAIMTPSQILDRLGDRLSLLRGGTSGPEHHRTIEATIAWSYDLLDEATQKLLRFLSVFEGGFELEQVEAMGGDEAVDRLADLVGKPLLHRDGDRFGMLESVRQYAKARLEENGEGNAARRRHFEFFADWGHQVYHRDVILRLDPIERSWATSNLQDLHRAISYGIDHDRLPLAAELAVVLWRHYIDALYGRSTRDWFAPLLPHVDRLDPELQIAILHGSGAIAAFRGDHDRGGELLRAELEVFERTRLIPRTGTSPYNNLGVFATWQGRWSEAIRWYEAGIDSLKDGVAKIGLLGNLARAIVDVHGDAHQALILLQQAKQLADLAGLETAGAIETVREVEMYIRLGDLVTAEQLIGDLLPTINRDGVRSDVRIGALQRRAEIAFAKGDLAAASILYLEAIDIDHASALAMKNSPVWHTWESLRLAELLVALGHPLVAARVVGEYRSTGNVAPHHQAELDRIQRQVDQVQAFDTPVSSKEPSLVDAVRHALAGRSHDSS